MIAVDTNVLVRLIVHDDPRQAATAKSFIGGAAWVSVLSLTEAIWVLETVYRLTSKELAKVIEMLLSHQDLVLQDSDAVEGALELFSAKPSLGFSDCLMLELARKGGHLPMGTFDRSLAKVKGARQL